MSKNNVIDLTSRFGKQAPNKNEPAKNPFEETGGGEVISFSDRKSEKSDEDRRNVTRTVLSQFVGVFAVIGEGILQPIHIFDISTSGLAFDMAKDVGSFNRDELVTLRIYISHETYFSFSAKIANVREIPHQGVVRHGSSFKKAAHSSEEALYHFVRFLETVSSTAKKDKGEKISGRVD